MHPKTEHHAEAAVRPLGTKAKLEAAPAADRIEGVESGPKRASAIHKRFRLEPRGQHAVKSLHDLGIDNAILRPEPETLRPEGGQDRVGERGDVLRLPKQIPGVRI